jgi:hypothetical protein
MPLSAAKTLESFASAGGGGLQNGLHLPGGGVDERQSYAFVLRSNLMGNLLMAARAVSRPAPGARRATTDATT